MNSRHWIVAPLATGAVAFGLAAQDAPAHDHAAHDHTAPAEPAAEHGHAQHDDDAAPAEHAQHDHGAGAEQATPADSLPPVTEAERAAAFPDVSGMPAMTMGDMNPVTTLVMLERFETQDAAEGSVTSWDLNAWVGRDLGKLWIRTEGERLGGDTERADLEMLWGRSFSPWWELVAGAREDFEPGNARALAAIGLQGVTPLRIALAATAYAGDGGRAAARVESHYEVRITNRVLLQPRVELNWSSSADPARGEGAGLTDGELGVRVRFEIRREIAPYLGLEHSRRFGGTADAARRAGEDARDTRLVAGIRLWF